MGTMNARQTDEQKKEINKIKKSTLFLYAEATMPDKEEAMGTALDILQNEAQKWAQEKKKKKEVDTNLVLINIEQICNRMELPRGNMYRAFVYVKKADIFTAKNTVMSKIKTAPERKETSGEKNKLTSTYETINTPDTENKKQAEKQSEVVKRLLTLKTFEEVQPCLLALKNEGKVTSYNKYAALPHPEEYVLIIYNRQAEIEAVLSEGNNRINLGTNRPDNITNYKGRGAIGVKLSK